MRTRCIAISCHRGAALLIVLAVLMITITATTILLSRVADIRLQRQMVSSEIVADDLLLALEAPIQHWLEADASKVVLLPDAKMPATSLLHDRWSLQVTSGDAIDVDVSIAAFDQYGMVPMQLARSGSPLRLALPADVLQRLDAIELPPMGDATQLGLDLLLSAQALDDGTSIHMFPQTVGESPLLFGELGKGELEQTYAISSGSAHVEGAILGMGVKAGAWGVGGLVATHNREPMRININTAPMPLVEAAMRLAGRGGIDQVIAARSKGRSANIEQPPAGVGPGTGATANRDTASANVPQIVTASDRWAFRIDIRVGALQRSWWAIYGPAPDRRDDKSWMCLQRLPISE